MKGLKVSEFRALFEQIYKNCDDVITEEDIAVIFSNSGDDYKVVLIEDGFERYKELVRDRENPFKKFILGEIAKIKAGESK